jgi:hypothetical protein
MMRTYTTNNKSLNINNKKEFTISFLSNGVKFVKTVLARNEDAAYLVVQSRYDVDMFLDVIQGNKKKFYEEFGE